MVEEEGAGGSKTSALGKVSVAEANHQTHSVQPP